MKMENLAKECENNLQDYFIQLGEASPYANLLVDLAFKKAFDPDKVESRRNLINLLNDLLGPQLPHPIECVQTRKTEQNVSGSDVSRSAIFDLHCKDNFDNLIVVEVQIRKMTNFLKRLGYYAGQMVVNQGESGRSWNFAVKPTFVVALTQHKIFGDKRVFRRGATIDLESGEPLFDSYNYMIVELPKVLPKISVESSGVEKWLFLLRFLHRLRELPDALKVPKFENLTMSSKVSSFTKAEFEEYQKMINAEYDRNAMWPGIEEDFADKINAKVSLACKEARREERLKHEVNYAALEMEIRRLRDLLAVQGR